LNAQRAQDQAARYQSVAQDRSLAIPETPPNIRETGFYVKSADSLHFAEEVALGSDLAASLHMVSDDEGNQSFNTRITDSKLRLAVGLVAIDAIMASAIALAKALDWPLDDAVATEIKTQVECMLEEVDTERQGEDV
jgi:hypothetical protein